MQQDKRGALDKEIERLNKQYGAKAAVLGSVKDELEVVPTGSLALDYALGTGGWPLGYLVHVYGPPDIGKSSTLGLAALRNAQAQGKYTGLISVEHSYDADWARKHGVDPDMLVVAYPNDADQAFEMLFEWAQSKVLEFIVFDSIGALINPKEAEEKGKIQVGGVSSWVTFGIKRIMPHVSKNKKGVLLLNQIRDDLGASYQGMLKTPGGHLLDHMCAIHVRLRQTSGSEHMLTIDDPHDSRIKIKVGRNLTAQIDRNKLSQGTGHAAKFWYYSMDTEQYGPVGIDETKDTVTMAIRTGIISKRGTWFEHDAFPDGHKLQGVEAVNAYVAANPQLAAEIRTKVLDIMAKIHTPLWPDLKVV